MDQRGTLRLPIQDVRVWRSARSPSLSFLRRQESILERTGSHSDTRIDSCLRRNDRIIQTRTSYHLENLLMEELFAPMGDNHLILDGREDARQIPWRFVLVSVLVISTLGLSIFGLLWQRTQTFSAPISPITLRLTRDGERAFSQQNLPVAIPVAWRMPLTKPSVFPLILGGDSVPQWAIIPFWRSTPRDWSIRERHGLYKLVAFSDASRVTNPRSFARFQPMQKVDQPLGYGETLSPDHTFRFVFSSYLVITSLPFSLLHPLPNPSRANHYVLQNSSFDDAFLRFMSVDGQGLSGWRNDLASVAWEEHASSTAWELTFREASSTLLHTLTNASSTKTSLFTLEDGTLQPVTSSLAGETSSTLPHFETEPLTSFSSSTCVDPSFQPMAKFRELLPRFETLLGSRNGFFSLCLSSR